MIAFVFDRETRRRSRVADSAHATRWIRTPFDEVRRCARAFSGIGEVEFAIRRYEKMPRLAGITTSDLVSLACRRRRAHRWRWRWLNVRSHVKHDFSIAQRKPAFDGWAQRRALLRESSLQRPATIFDRVRPRIISRHERARCSVAVSPGSSPCRSWLPAEIGQRRSGTNAVARHDRRHAAQRTSHRRWSTA